jgi:hypothetical protein
VFEFFKALKRVNACEARLDGIERLYRKIDADIDSLNERVVRVSRRMSRREEPVLESDGQPDTGAEETATPPTAISPLWSKLTARQKQLQIGILNRRKVAGG